MIKIIVEGPAAVGKTHFIRHYLEPALAQAQADNFQLSIGGLIIVERRPKASYNPSDQSHQT